MRHPKAGNMDIIDFAKVREARLAKATKEKAEPYSRYTAMVEALSKEDLTVMEYQGYDGIAHGGILTTMLDESMAGYLNKELGEKAVTARLDIRYRKPVPIGEELVITSWVESRKGSFVSMKGSIALPDGTIAVEGSGKLAIVEQAE